MCTKCFHCYDFNDLITMMLLNDMSSVIDAKSIQKEEYGEKIKAELQALTELEKDENAGYCNVESSVNDSFKTCFAHNV